MDNKIEESLKGVFANKNNRWIDSTTELITLMHEHNLTLMDLHRIKIALEILKPVEEKIKNSQVKK